MAQWELEETTRYVSRYKHFDRKHSRELQALRSNLERFVDAINDGQLPHMVTGKFIHNESDGIRALDQTGGFGRGLMESRLYLFADTSEQVLYLLCIGDKGEQKKDMIDCRRMVGKLKKRKGDPDGKEI